MFIVWEHICTGLSGGRGVKRIFLPHLIITDGEWAPFHPEPDMLVGFGKHTHPGMQNWTSVTDFPASMAVHSSPLGAHPLPEVPACAHSMFSCNLFQPGGTVNPQLSAGVGSVFWVLCFISRSQAWVGVSAGELPAGPIFLRLCLCSCQTCFSGPRSPCRWDLVSPGRPSWSLLFWVPACCSAFSWTAQDGQCLLDWGVSISYPFNAVLFSEAKTCSVSTCNLVSFLCLAHPSEWGQFQVLGHFLLLPHPLGISNPMAISSWDRIFMWIIYIFTLNAKITQRYFKLSTNIFL